MVRLIILRLSESYFRNRGLYQLPLVLMIVLAGLYVLFAPRVYIARGTLYTQNTSLLSSLTARGGSSYYSWISSAQSTANEINELLSTEAFVRAALSRTSLEAEIERNPQILDDAIRLYRRSVWVQPLGESLVLIGAKSDDPQTAQQLSQGLLDSYLHWKLDADLRESTVAQEFFARLLDPYQTELEAARKELEAYIAAHPEPIRGNRPPNEQLEIELLRSRVSRIAEQISTTKANEENARLALSQAESDVFQNYRLVDAPKLPSEPELSLRDVLQNIIIFVAVGGVLAVAGIVGDVLIDRSLRFPIDVHHGLELPVLAMLSDVNAAPSPSLIARLVKRKRSAPTNKPLLQPLIAVPTYLATAAPEREVDLDTLRANPGPINFEPAPQGIAPTPNR